MADEVKNEALTTEYSPNEESQDEVTTEGSEAELTAGTNENETVEAPKKKKKKKKKKEKKELTPEELHLREVKTRLVKIEIEELARALNTIPELADTKVEYSGFSKGKVKIFDKKTRTKSERWVTETFGRTYRNPAEFMDYVVHKQFDNQYVTDLRLIKGVLYVETRTKGITVMNDYFLMTVSVLNPNEEGKDIPPMTRKQCKHMLKVLYEKTHFDGSQLIAPLPKVDNKITKPKAG